MAIKKIKKPNYIKIRKLCLSKHYIENEKHNMEKIFKTQVIDKGMVSKIYSKCLQSARKR